jgi:hypothetical protein
MIANEGSLNEYGRDPDVALFDAAALSRLVEVLIERSYA